MFTIIFNLALKSDPARRTDPLPPLPVPPPAALLLFCALLCSSLKMKMGERLFRPSPGHFRPQYIGAAGGVEMHYS